MQHYRRWINWTNITWHILCIIWAQMYILLATLSESISSSLVDYDFLYLALIFNCDQAALQMVLSVCPSVCLYLVEICRSYYQWPQLGPCKRSRSEVKGQGHRSHNLTVTPVWINIWWWNDAFSLMLLRKSVLMFFKVIHQISRSHGSKNRRIWPRLGVSGL